MRAATFVAALMHFNSSAPPEQIAALREALARPRRIAVTAHYNPDGDAMGSTLGLALVLRALGHEVPLP